MPLREPRSAIVTGGAGGIGTAIGRRLAIAGYIVIVADADAAEAERAASALPPVGSGGHCGVGGDLTTGDANRAVVDAARAAAPIGAIVNAVGISPKDDGHKRAFFDISEGEWDAVLAVNLKAPFLLAQQAYPHLPEDGSASIVNVLSIVAWMGTGGPVDASFPPNIPSSAAYAASKGGLRILTASLARELAPKGVRVNGVAPGFVATPMMAAVPEHNVSELAAQVPLQRFATADEVADAVDFLVSDRASYITGESIAVNGGWHTL